MELTIISEFIRTASMLLIFFIVLNYILSIITIQNIIISSLIYWRCGTTIMDRVNCILFRRFCAAWIWRRNGNGVQQMGQPGFKLSRHEWISEYWLQWRMESQLSRSTPQKQYRRSIRQIRYELFRVTRRPGILLCLQRPLPDDGPMPTHWFLRSAKRRDGFRC